MLKVNKPKKKPENKALWWKEVIHYAYILQYILETGIWIPVNSNKP